MLILVFVPVGDGDGPDAAVPPVPAVSPPAAAVSPPPAAEPSPAVNEPLPLQEMV